MSTKKIKLTTDFTDTPGGRYRAVSEKSGEEFREDFLRPALDKFTYLEVDLNNAFGFPYSFLDESFGIIIDTLGRSEFDRRFKILIDDDPVAKRRLDEVIRKHTK